jgi:glutathione peroxidase-family protein
VNGDDAHPLYKYLKYKQSGSFVDAIKWNFSKFLINHHGQPVKRYGPNVEPKDIERDIIDLLKEK